VTGPREFFEVDAPSLVTPSAAMAAGKKQPRVRPVVLVTFHGAMFSLLRTLSSPLALRKRAAGGAVLCNPPGRRHTLALCPVGASGTVLALENTIALGGKTLLFLGWCGSLNPACEMTHVVVPTSAVREEGTSHHYLPSSERVRASDHLVEAIVQSLKRGGIAHSTGPVWSTDAPYRETATKVRRYAEEGVLGVDMETSAIFALAAYRKCEAAGALIVSDELFGDSWNPGWQTHSSFKPRLLALARSMLACCHHLATQRKRGVS
jgi:uridine phosphorylase